jgi:D-3-phosphoglycerate dehydrogenase / 2-oxoglutarate reductase
MAALPVLWFDRPLTPDLVALLAGRATVAGPSQDELPGADGAVVGIAQRWDATTVASAPSVRVVSRTGIGYDNVDVDSLYEVGVTVCNAPDAPTVSTAEHTMTLLLALTKDLPANVARARQGETGPATLTALELDGATVGLVGYGRIARRVARACAALGMRVLVHDPFVDTADPANTEDEFTSLASLWAQSHVISLHAPATADTHHLICDASIAQMRQGVFIVNCARGSLIDHDALRRALDRGDIAGAALDVTDPEPLPVGHPLLTHPRVLVTPHCASSTTAGRIRLFSHAIDNALAVLSGEPASVVLARQAAKGSAIDGGPR